MSRNKHRDELEHLYKKVRSLESENRGLRRELKQARKFIDPFFEEADVLEEDTGDTQVVHRCPKCSNKNVSVVQLGPKMLYHCLECQWRRTEVIKK